MTSKSLANNDHKFLKYFRVSILCALLKASIHVGLGLYLATLYPPAIFGTIALLFGYHALCFVMVVPMRHFYAAANSYLERRDKARVILMFYSACAIVGLFVFYFLASFLLDFSGSLLFALLLCSVATVSGIITKLFHFMLKNAMMAEAEFGLTVVSSLSMLGAVLYAINLNCSPLVVVATYLCAAEIFKSVMLGCLYKLKYVTIDTSSTTDANSQKPETTKFSSNLFFGGVSLIASERLKTQSWRLTVDSFAGIEALGILTRAFSFSNMVYQLIVGPFINTVAIHKANAKTLEVNFLSMQAKLGLFFSLTCIYILLAFSALPAFLFLGGPEWQSLQTAFWFAMPLFIVVDMNRVLTEELIKEFRYLRSSIPKFFVSLLLVSYSYFSDDLIDLKYLICAISVLFFIENVVTSILVGAKADYALFFVQLLLMVVVYQTDFIASQIINIELEYIRSVASGLFG